MARIGPFACQEGRIKTKRIIRPRYFERWRKLILPPQDGAFDAWSFSGRGQSLAESL